MRLSRCKGTVAAARLPARHLHGRALVPTLLLLLMLLFIQLLLLDPPAEHQYPFPGLTLLPLLLLFVYDCCCCTHQQSITVWVP
jgi:hypothetical protein